MSPHNYIRRHRKRVGLSQAELGFLLGADDGKKISRYESQTTNPTLTNAFACEAVFRVPARLLFPGIYTEVERSVIARAQELSAHLQIGTEKSAEREQKLAFLAELLAAEALRARPPTWEHRRRHIP